MVSCLLLLPWGTDIAGYQISSNKSNNQKQPTAGYRQESKLLPGVSPATREIITTNRIIICTWDNLSILTPWLQFCAQTMVFSCRVTYVSVVTIISTYLHIHTYLYYTHMYHLAWSNTNLMYQGHNYLYSGK